MSTGWMEWSGWYPLDSYDYYSTYGANKYCKQSNYFLSVPSFGKIEFCTMFTEHQFLYQICYSQYFQTPNQSFKSIKNHLKPFLIQVCCARWCWVRPCLTCGSCVPMCCFRLCSSLIIWINLHVLHNGYRGLWSIHEKLVATNDLLFRIKHLGKKTLWEWKAGIFIQKQFVTPMSLLVQKLKHTTHIDNTSNVTSI